MGNKGKIKASDLNKQLKPAEADAKKKCDAAAAFLAKFRAAQAAAKKHLTGSSPSANERKMKAKRICTAAKVAKKEWKVVKKNLDAIVKATGIAAGKAVSKDVNGVYASASQLSPARLAAKKNAAKAKKEKKKAKKETKLAKAN